MTMKNVRCLLFIILLALSSGYVFGQKRVITGKVFDKNTGTPLLGANILIDKVKGGVATKEDGSYTISVSSAQNTLVISFIGYATQIIQIGINTKIDITLLPASAADKEVVVIGYGTQKKSEITGAVSKYKNEKLDQSPVTRLDQALQGKIAGVQVQNTSSEAGADPKVQVRGVSSINAGQSPLVVVDGHPVPDGLAFVNMSDVESVEVLKDAASAAIYGSRGASGVILITTKSGKSDKAKFNIKISNGHKNPYKVYAVMSTTDYLNLMYKEGGLRAIDTAYTNYASTSQAAANYNWATAAEKGAYLVEKNLNGGVGTDWQAATLRTGNVKNLDVSVSGGNKDVKYFISGAYQNDQGMIRHSEYERYNFRSRIDAQVSKN